MTPKIDWQICFKHLLNGPISKVSTSISEETQFAVLYHVIENDDIRHFIRVYYLASETSEYKDLLLPGNTMINAISLEQDSILFSR